MERYVGVNLNKTKVLIDIKDEDGYSICSEFDDISYENVLSNDILTFNENSEEISSGRNKDTIFISLQEFFKLVIQLNK